MNRLCLFGDIDNEAMRLHAAGQMVRTAWEAIPARHPGVDIDVFVVMPNHVHGIILLNDDALPRQVSHLAAVVGAFKSRTTVEFLQGIKASGWPRLPGRLWQRNYYEHIIRGEPALNHVRQYIADNPTQWANDAENPANIV